MTIRLSPDLATVDRFRADLGRLCDVDADRILVAVSGGPDSLALLLLTHAVFGQRCIAATVDHGLRAEAAGEALGVARLCADRGIAHHVLTGAMPDRAGRTANISARARLFRYRLLEERAAESGARFVATGHHADDQLETLLMRLNRGAGVAGLAGIRVKGGRIIRPLLGWRRAELTALVASCGLIAVDDPSNVDDRYDRARLRKMLADADWLDVAQVARSAAALGDAEDALAWTVRYFEDKHCLVEDVSVSLYPDSLPFELRRRLVASCVARIAPDLEMRGGALARLVETLEQGVTMTIGDVWCVPDRDRHRKVLWRFSDAPPRR